MVMFAYSTAGPKRDGSLDHEPDAGGYFVNGVPGARADSQE